MVHRMNMSLHVRRVAPILFAVSICMSLSFASFAAEQQFTIITTEQMKSMIDEKKPMVLIDARTKDEYQEAHIDGAISMPEKTFDDQTSMLPSDKNALLVLYCNGVKCGKSKKAAAKAAAKGYTNILVYGDGFPVWEEKGYKIVPGPAYAKKVETTKISPIELKKLIDAKADSYVLVDVRDEAEFSEGHIPGAINIPAETFASRSEVLPKDKKVIVYCNTGGRSYMAYRKLMKLGYTDIAQTLFANWKEAGMPVAK
jgi:rhodanese-related sulfurtransferase